LTKRIKSLLFLIIAVNVCLNSEEIIFNTPRAVARIENIILYRTDVIRVAAEMNIPYETAKQVLIEDTILYLAATTIVESPTDDEVDLFIKDQKYRFAARIGVPYIELTDQRFVDALYNNNLNFTKYRELIKQNLWIQKLLDMRINNQIESIQSTPTEPEIRAFINNNQSFFIEEHKIVLSHIFLSYNTLNNNENPQQRIEQINRLSLTISDLLKNGTDFYELVNRYSDDEFSKSNNPPGLYGEITLDDPEIIRKFGSEIISVFNQSDVGVVETPYITPTGIFFFKIESNTPGRAYSDSESLRKAAVLIRQQRENNLINRLRSDIITEYSRIFRINIF